MKQETNMEHSAEWLRGAVAVARDVREPLAVAHYTKLLAAAEAREAGEPSAAEVISKVRAELLKCLDNAKTLPQDARQAGVVAGWESAIDLLEALCDGSIMDTVKPTTADVIREAKAALADIRAAVTTSTGQCGVMGTNWAECDYCGAVSRERMTPIPHEKGCAVSRSTEALATISAWEASNDR